MKLPFNTQQILDLINSELKQCKRKIKAIKITKTEDKNLIVDTNRGGKLFVMLYLPHDSVIAIRAIHSIIKKHTGFTYLFNGQPGRNLRELVFNGENGQLHYATKEEYRNHLLTTLNDSLSDEDKDVYISRRMKGLEKFNPNFA